jgi:deazaflavin-dependent oxidoreductase (nitroreductase family)
LVDAIRDPDCSWQGGGKSSYRAYSDFPTTQPGAIWARSARAKIRETRPSLWGGRILHVRGRTSGAWRTTPVNLLTHEGRRYLVSPRGQTQLVRNLRAAGGGELHLGRRVERFAATELADEAKPPVLRAYLDRWG